MKKLLSTLFISTLILFSHASIADEFVVGVENIEYYPIYAKRDSAYTGYARAILDAFAEKSGHSFTYKMLPIKRLFVDFVKGDLDLKFPDSPYWKKDLKQGKNIIYSESVLEYIDGVLVVPEALGKGKGELKTLGILRGFTPWEYLDDIKAKRMKLKEVNSLKSLVNMSNAGRINGVYSNVIVAKYFLEHTILDKRAVVFDGDLPHTRGNYYMSSIKHPKLIASFNKFMAENESLVESLKVKYEVKLN